MKRSRKPAGRIRPECHRSTEEKMLAAELERIDLIVGPRVSGSARIVPGSRKFPCSVCGESIWLSPKTVALNIKAPVACMECAVKMAEKHMDEGDTVSAVRTDGKNVDTRPWKGDGKL